MVGSFQDTNIDCWVFNFFKEMGVNPVSVMQYLHWTAAAWIADSVIVYPEWEVSAAIAVLMGIVHLWLLLLKLSAVSRNWYHVLILFDMTKKSVISEVIDEDDVDNEDD